MIRNTAIALIALGGVMPAAYAQSSVTLYGVLDAGVGYTSNQRVAQSSGAAGKPVAYTGPSNYAFASGTWYGDRWGFKGNEDLGGGLAAVFQLENGFNIGTGKFGQGGAEFGRQAWMGLASRPLGKITLGRQYDPIVDFVGTISAGSFLSGMGAHPGDLDNIDNQSRESNSVKYTSPSFSGLQFGALYGFGGQAGSIANQNTWSFGGQYVNGPLAIGAAFMRANNTAGANGGAWTGAYDGTFTSSINEGFASSQSQQIIAAASTYQIGPVTLGLSYSNTQYKAGSFSLFKGKETFNSAGLTLAYHATPALTLAGGYDYTRGSSVNAASAPRYNQFNLATFYSLSKRTSLYALAGYQKASGTTLDPFGNLVSATASVGDVGNGISSAGNTQTLVRIGIRQAF